MFQLSSRVASVRHEDQAFFEDIPNDHPIFGNENLTEMQLNGSMSAGDIIDMPEGAKLVTPAEAMVVHCVPPAEEPEPEEYFPEVVRVAARRVEAAHRARERAVRLLRVVAPLLQELLGVGDGLYYRTG